MTNVRRLALAATPLLLALSVASAGAGEPTYELTIHEHRFEPERLTIPAGKEIALVVTNADATPEEFESHELNREKMIPGGATAKILIGPLEPGEYPFFGEFNMDTAQGVIVAE